MDFVASLPGALTSQSRRFFAEWHRWRGTGLVPQRSVLDTAKLGDLLLRCLLLEIRGRDAIPIRFAGTQIGELLGANLAGRDYLDLTEPHNRARRAALLFTEVAQPCAAVIYYWLRIESGAVLPVELVSAPLCADGETAPSLVLACATPLIKGSDHATEVQPDSYAEGEGLRFIDIGAGLPPVGPDIHVGQQVQ
ncbi:MAG: PAS domain-containing protein [Ferrovibrio sp.]